MPTTRPRGRRPGPSTTRDAIAQAARELFAEQGYDRAAVRAIAARAGVDARLVTHHFGSKQRLFVEAMGLPVDPAQVLGALPGDPAGVGERLARVMVGVLCDGPSRQRLIGFLRAAATEPAAAAVLRDALAVRLLGPLAAGLGDGAGLRFELAASQLIGIVMTRYVVGVEPIASVDPDALVALVAPVLQHYLGPIVMACGLFGTVGL